MKIYFIRHGQTDWNIAGRLQGSMDIELNATGISQAEELSNLVKKGNYNISKIYSSRQKRALKTAQILGAAINKEVIPVDGIQEINFGKWEGLGFDEIEKLYPEDYRLWFNNRRYTKPPMAESYNDVLIRALKAIKKIISENEDDVAIVTHGGLIMAMQCLLNDVAFEDMLKFSLKNTSVLELDSSDFIKVPEMI